MAGSGFDSGQSRVKGMEKNNRTGSGATGSSTKTPRKKGAQSGFASNKTKGGGIFRGLKSSGNSTLGS